jgi:deoxycytidylate deaminase
MDKPNASERRPELIFAMAGPLGTRLTALSDQLATELRSVGYNVIPIRVSALLQSFTSDWKAQESTGADARVRHLQGIANAVRGRLCDGAALARAAIVEIRRRRAELSAHPDNALDAYAFIIDQLKHPEEARLLRETYGDAFYLVGGHASRGTRVEEFARLIANSLDQSGQNKAYEGRASDLIEADDKSADKYGQNMRDTYPQADIFVDLNPVHGEHSIRRFVELLFGHPFRTPTPEEYAMYLASAVSLRSSDSSRQVGAAIVDIACSPDGKVRNADVLSVGMNEVPRAGGGFYWDGESPDARDQFLLPEDRARNIKTGLLAQLIGRIRAEKWLGVEAGNGDDSELARQLLPKLDGTQFMDIGEFSRPVHAEMAAIIDAARRGVSINGCSIYVTTFPCHNCAKHIVAAGLTRVVYLEPYPKSRADNLYHEELRCDSPDGKAQEGKVVFSAYSGVAPRQYGKLFSMTLRGTKYRPNRIEWERSRQSLRPLYVADHLQNGYVIAERQALQQLRDTGFDWDEKVTCPA